MPENNFIHLFSSSENQIKIKRLKLELYGFLGTQYASFYFFIKLGLKLVNIILVQFKL
jgi:hypothetical protein